FCRWPGLPVGDTLLAAADSISCCAHSRLAGFERVLGAVSGNLGLVLLEALSVRVAENEWLCFLVDGAGFISGRQLHATTTLVSVLRRGLGRSRDGASTFSQRFPVEFSGRIAISNPASNPD